jgi:hypothetical protein
MPQVRPEPREINNSNKIIPPGRKDNQPKPRRKYIAKNAITDKIKVLNKRDISFVQSHREKN